MDLTSRSGGWDVRRKRQYTHTFLNNKISDNESLVEKTSQRL